VQVYRLEATEDASRLHCRVESEYSRVADLMAEPVAVTDWQPPSVQLIRDGSAGSAPSDLVMLGMEPAFTRRAVDALGDLLTDNGQLLPLVSADGEFYLWNVTRVVDAFDEEKSQVLRFSSGRIMTVDRWAFKPEAVARQVVFKVPQFLRGFTFAMGTFLDRFTEAGLVGISPEPLWRQP
jgi:hypothetical protein